MAFKSMEEYNEVTHGNKFRLSNNGDHEDVIFLYRSVKDVLVGDVHYLKLPEFSGYVHCLERECPVCNSTNSSGNSIRLQRRIFIPMYIISQNKVVFWDKTTSFEAQFKRDVLDRYSDPSKVVFRITRHGEYRDINTTYSITAIATNNTMSYDEICAKFNIKFPDFYETICSSKTSAELQDLMSGTGMSAPINQELPEYQVTPRAIINDSQLAVGSNPVDTSDNDTSNLPDYDSADTLMDSVKSAAEDQDHTLMTSNNLSPDEKIPF